ncbi:MAG: UvrD-helicase domain-containing protein [Kofleriaceae bacterium]
MSQRATTALGDAEARRAIREDLGATLVVEAAAGTGKTTEMIARIIAVIRTGAGRLEEIVAVTFTEKAAGEMKLRLRTELEHARQAAAGADRTRLQAALGELEVARIGSIHSFCADLLRERPIEARIDPLFEVAAEDDAERIYTEVFERWLQLTLAAPGDGVRRMLRRKAPTEQLRRAGWALVERRDFTGAWRRDPFDRDAAIDGVLHELAGFAALGDLASDPRDKLAALCHKLDRWLAELGRRESVRARDHDGLEAELAEVKRWWEWKPAGGRAQRFGKDLLRADVVLRRDGARGALDAFLRAADADLAARLHAELAPLITAYEEAKGRAGRLDFLDLLARARDLLRDDPRVRREMQRRFSHFFVDEFQDTDPLQVEILMLLCADDPACAEPAHARALPGKLFVVGDPKQAIYRFRRADITLYEAVKHRLVAEGARPLYLTTSFRSVPAIQTAINAAFEPVMRGNGQATYVPLAPSRDDAPPPQPAVIALPVPRPYGTWNVTNAAIEASYPDAVAAFVDELITKMPWLVTERGDEARVRVAPRHVCLMFRRFQSFGRDLTRPYVRALEARGIPHVLMGGRSFHEREEIVAARNALSAIEWPSDELSVYATLKGPFFAFHDEDLVAFRHVHHRLHPLAWLDPARRVALGDPPADAQVAIAGALAILGELHGRRNRRPIADTLARLLAATRAHAGVAVWPAGEQALANLFRVMDLARRFETTGATSFRAFVDRIESDAERGRQPDAPVVEDGTEGVRIMTVHAAKGLEFPVVILCDPTAPLSADRPSHWIDSEREVWLEALAGCVPTELRDHEVEVMQHDREEGERLAYVAVTRARDLLVVPVVGDEQREGWLQALDPVVFPDPARKRKPAPMPGYPFGDDSVVDRSAKTDRMPTDSVAPGVHQPRAGAHAVVWWDPNKLELDREPGGGVRRREILQADEANDNAAANAGIAAHAAWQQRRASALAAGARATITVKTVTAAAELAAPTTLATPSATPRDAGREQPAAGLLDVRLDMVSGKRGARPRGKRFGTLVHAILAAVELRGDVDHVRRVGANQARLVGATPEERDAAIVAVCAALCHPLMVRAAEAGDRGALRREVPVVVAAPDGLVEGVVDLAFEQAGAWTVVDFKTDAELAHRRPIYEAQVRAYANAIAVATGRAAHPVLLIV